MTAMINLAVLFLVVTSIQLWIFAVVRLWNGKPLVALEPRQKAPWGLSDILMSIFFQMLVHSLAHEQFRRTHGLTGQFELDKLGLDLSSGYIAVMAWSSLAAMALTLGWLLLRHRASAKDLGLSIRHVGLDILLGVRAFVMLAPVVYAIQFVFVELVKFKSEHPLLEMLKKDPSSRFFVMSGFAAVIVAPIVEEFFFRLLLQGWFERLGTGRDRAWQVFFGGRKLPEEESTPGVVPDDSAEVTALDLPHTSLVEEPIENTPARIPRWTIVLSALLFALAHAANGPDPVPLFVLALGLGYLYQRTHRILPAIIVHFLLNATTLTMMWLTINEKR